jgi:capsular polysaccharide export protein
MNFPVNELLSSQKVMLLQGPMGSFFKKLAVWLHAQSIEYHKVNFSAGDWLFFHGENTLNYHGKLSTFAAWLSQKCLELDIDALVCFGDCRFYHVEAQKVAEKLGIKFLVFEEGYIRPNYLTLELGGVNEFSKIKDKFLSYQHSFLLYDRPDHPIEVHSSYSLLVKSACIFYLAWIFFFWLFPFYQHHRKISPLAEMFYWARSFVRRSINYYIEPHRFLDIIKKYDKRFYVVALQVHNDSQVRVHSDYADVKDFIIEVLESFSRHALPDQHLVFKHHPMDRGYRHYGHLIRTYASHLNVMDRVHYVCDVHLPTLLKHSLGLVTINSTTGLQALYHEKPVKVMGRAIYHLPKLTYQGELDQFWKNPGRVNRLAYRHFRYILVHYSQLNGSYYGASPWMEDSNKNDPSLMSTQHSPDAPKGKINQW